MQATSLDQYFETARQLPIATPLANIHKIVEIRSAQGFDASSSGTWTSWGLNSLLIGLILSAGVYLGMNPFSESSMVAQYEANGKMPRVKSIPLVALAEEEEVANEREFAITQEGLSFSQNSQLKEAPAGYQESSNTHRSQESGPVWWPQAKDSVLDKEKPITEVVERHLMDSTQQNEIIEGVQKVITKELELKKTAGFKLANAGGNIVIKTWNESKVKMTATVNIETRDEDERQAALQDFDLNLEWSGSDIEVHNNWNGFTKSTCACSFAGEKIQTEKGEKIKIKKMKIDYEVYVPEDFDLNLKCNYGNVTVPNIQGRLSAKMFQGNIEAGRAEKGLDYVGRYGKAQLAGAPEASIRLFQSQAEIGPIEKGDIDAKYSTVNLAQASEIEVSGFQSNVTIDKNGASPCELSGSIKYGKLELGESAKRVDLNLFQAKVFAQNIDVFIIRGSYSSIKADDINHLELKKSFQDAYSLRRVNSMNGNTKYTKMNIKELGKDLTLETFQGSLDIEVVVSDFDSVKIDAKYTPIALQFDPESKYSFSSRTNYTAVKYPKNQFVISLDKSENQSQEIQAMYNSGSSKSTSKVEVNAFQGKVLLR